MILLKTVLVPVKECRGDYPRVGQPTTLWGVRLTVSRRSAGSLVRILHQRQLPEGKLARWVILSGCACGDGQAKPADYFKILVRLLDRRRTSRLGKTRRGAAPSRLQKTCEGTPRDGRSEQAAEVPRTEADGVGQDRSGYALCVT